MALERVFRSWRIYVFVSSVVVAAPLLAGDPLFPRPVHLTRKIVDPLASVRQTVVEEYCEGNRVVTVNGTTTVIVDYARQTLTEIDRSASTYSITPFSEIAAHAAADEQRAGRSARGGREPQAVSAGQRLSSAGRRVESFEIAGRGGDHRVRIDIDRSMTVSRQALEVLLGSAYPGAPSGEHDAVVAAARTAVSGRIQSDAASSSDADRYGLPVEQSIEITSSGATLLWTSVVVRIGDETAPPAMLSIPPGARLVESKRSATRRALDDLDRLPSRPIR